MKLTRRNFLRGSAAAIATPAFSSLLQAGAAQKISNTLGGNSGSDNPIDTIELSDPTRKYDPLSIELVHDFHYIEYDRNNWSVEPEEGVYGLQNSEQARQFAAYKLLENPEEDNGEFHTIAANLSDGTHSITTMDSKVNGLTDGELIEITLSGGTMTGFGEYDDRDVQPMLEMLRRNNGGEVCVEIPETQFSGELSFALNNIPGGTSTIKELLFALKGRGRSSQTLQVNEFFLENIGPQLDGISEDAFAHVVFKRERGSNSFTLTLSLSTQKKEGANTPDTNHYQRLPISEHGETPSLDSIMETDLPNGGSAIRVVFKPNWNYSGPDFIQSELHGMGYKRSQAKEVCLEDGWHETVVIFPGTIVPDSMEETVKELCNSSGVGSTYRSTEIQHKKVVHVL